MLLVVLVLLRTVQQGGNTGTEIIFNDAMNCNTIKGSVVVVTAGWRFCCCCFFAT